MHIFIEYPSRNTCKWYHHHRIAYALFPHVPAAHLPFGSYPDF